MKFTKKKLIIAISILLVVCLLSTIAIYFFSPKSKFGVLCIGMTFEECHNALPKSEGFYYGGYVFYTNAWGDYVVARFAGPYNNRSIVELKHFYKWTPYPVAFIINFVDFRNGYFSGFSLSQYMGLILAHEVAHILGMKDTYRGAYNDCPTTQVHREAEIDCLMAAFVENVSDIHDACTNGSPFCAFCESKLNEIIAPDILTTNS